MNKLMRIPAALAALGLAATMAACTFGSEPDGPGGESPSSNESTSPAAETTSEEVVPASDFIALNEAEYLYGVMVGGVEQNSLTVSASDGTGEVLELELATESSVEVVSLAEDEYDTSCGYTGDEDLYAAWCETGWYMVVFDKAVTEDAEEHYDYFVASLVYTYSNYLMSHNGLEGDETDHACVAGLVTAGLYYQDLVDNESAAIIRDTYFAEASLAERFNEGYENDTCS